MAHPVTVVALDLSSTLKVRALPVRVAVSTPTLRLDVVSPNSHGQLSVRPATVPEKLNNRYEIMNSWQILNIKPGSDETTIKSAFRRQALKVHPDVGGSAEEFKRLYKAFEECLREVDVLDINLNEIFAGTELSSLLKLFQAMNINAYAESFDFQSLIGRKVRFTFDPTSPNSHYEDRRKHNELEKGDKQ